MDEVARSFVAVRRRTRQVMREFLRTELAAARILCTLAKVNSRSASADEHLRRTRIAIDEVGRFMWSVRVQPRELDQLTAQIELLRFELESVQRTRPGAQGVADVSRGILADRSARRNARTALAIHPE